MGKESRRPHGMRWNNRNKRWEWIGFQTTASKFYIDANGYLTDLTAIDDTNVSVGSLLTTDTLRVTVTGSIANLNTTTGTITNANVGSTLIAQRIIMAGIGSLASITVTNGTMANVKVGTLATIEKAAITDLAVGGGTSITKFAKLTGTITGIAAVGTCATAVATVTGITAATGVFAIVRPKTAIAGNIIFGNALVPSTDTLNVTVANTKADSAGSLPHVGVDVWLITG